MTIRELIEKKGEEDPEKTFLFFKDIKKTYKEIDEITNRVGNRLLNLGIKKGENISVLLPNCPEFIYFFFGIMKAGSVAVPINFNLKDEEVAYILDNSETVALVTCSQFMEMISRIRPRLSDLKHIITIDNREPKDTISLDSILDSSPAPLSVPLIDGDCASIIYTSGTTGKPKGVILTHKNYIFDTVQFVNATQMTKDDRFLCILPLFHVNGQVVTTLSPLYAGASMVLMEKFSPRDFFPTLAEFKATAFSGVPTIYSILLNLPDAEMYNLSSLRFCVCGAAPMPAEVFKKFEEKFKAYILEGYGLSEGTCVSSVNPLGRKRKIGSIGIPLPEQEMKIFDERDRELDTMDIGEIVVKGDNVMKGYFKNSEATASTLKNGWLYTGDLGYMDDDGYFYIVGRKKEMIIRGGENIYPKEIEELLYRHPEITEASVVGIPDTIWGEEVFAFIIPKEGEEIDEDDIIEYCKRHLADFKCPRKVIFVDTLPKTATGKIQKNKIKEEYVLSQSKRIL
ncbi:MAG: class I adenylate-forming enzyme family protein [Nitrospirota bacterium]